MILSILRYQYLTKTDVRYSTKCQYFAQSHYTNTFNLEEDIVAPSVSGKCNQLSHSLLSITAKIALHYINFIDKICIQKKQQCVNIATHPILPALRFWMAFVGSAPEITINFVLYFN